MRQVVTLICLLLAACSNEQGELEAKARSALDSFSKDPLAMQLREVRAMEGSQDQICGEVNLKNDQGAYSGFRVFLIANGQATIADPNFVRADYKPIRTCGTPTQVADFTQANKMFAARWHAEVDANYRKHSIELLEAQIALEKSRRR